MWRSCGCWCCRGNVRNQVGGNGKTQSLWTCEVAVEVASRRHCETVTSTLEREVSWSASSGKESMRALRSGFLSVGHMPKASIQESWVEKSKWAWSGWAAVVNAKWWGHRAWWGGRWVDVLGKMEGQVVQHRVQPMEERM